MEHLNPVGQLANFYSNQPILQALVQFTPIGGSSLDTLLRRRAKEIATERALTFYEELAQDGSILTPEIIQSEDFIHRYAITAKAAINTRRREKIRQFAQLLSASFKPGNAGISDQYEEYLSILDELSYRELSILNILEKFEISHPLKEDEHGLQRSSRFWEDFITETGTELSLDEDEINAILTRLNRTGCYNTFTGTFTGYGGDQGQLTSMYFKLKQLLNK